MHFKIGSSGAVILAVLCFGFLPVQPAGAQSPPPNFPALKAEMKIFEAVIDGTLAQTFAPPFGLLEKTKGTYLPGFGLAFSLEVNLYPSRTPDLFETQPKSKMDLEKARKVEVERIAAIKEIVPRLLADHAISLRDLGSDEFVAVVVHLFIMQPGTDDLPGQLVIETRKSDLDRFWDKKISYRELVATMRILEI